VANNSNEITNKKPYSGKSQHILFPINVEEVLNKEITELLKLQNGIIDKLNDILKKLDGKLSA
jgi:hypothetical protein